jgi:flagellin
LAAIDSITGTSTASSVSSGKLVLSTGTTQNLVIGTGTGNALTALGLSAGTTAVTPPPLSGEILTITATGGGTPTSITFGTGANQVSTLNQLNTALAANNLQASIDSSSGAITITTSNDAASSTIGTIGGTAAASGQTFNGLTAAAPVADPNSQATRASLVAQYNNVLAQINTTAQDASFNGINLLNGDTLKLTFNETGKSTLSITGVTFNDAGLNLSTLTAGTDFLDNSSANKALTSLSAASTTLRTEASALGSNLSIVQIRQDFNKNLIDVLQTGSSNLTLADTNEEAANSQALSTRQSIAVSALALANQSQASVLQLLR